MIRNIGRALMVCGFLSMLVSVLLSVSGLTGWARWIENVAVVMFALPALGFMLAAFILGAIQLADL